MWLRPALIAALFFNVSNQQDGADGKDLVLYEEHHPFYHVQYIVITWDPTRSGGLSWLSVKHLLSSVYVSCSFPNNIQSIDARILVRRRFGSDLANVIGKITLADDKQWGYQIGRGEDLRVEASGDLTGTVITSKARANDTDPMGHAFQAFAGNEDVNIGIGDVIGKTKELVLATELWSTSYVVSSIPETKAGYYIKLIPWKLSGFSVKVTQPGLSTQYYLFDGGPLIIDVSNNAPTYLEATSPFYLVQFTKSSSTSDSHIAPAAISIPPPETYLDYYTFLTSDSVRQNHPSVISYLSVAIKFEDMKGLYIYSGNFSRYVGQDRANLTIGVDTWSTSWTQLKDNTYYTLFTSVYPYGKFGLILYEVCSSGQCTGGKYVSFSRGQGLGVENYGERGSPNTTTEVPSSTHSPEADTTNPLGLPSTSSDQYTGASTSLHATSLQPSLEMTSFESTPSTLEVGQTSVDVNSVVPTSMETTTLGSPSTTAGSESASATSVNRFVTSGAQTTSISTIGETVSVQFTDSRTASPTAAERSTPLSTVGSTDKSTEKTTLGFSSMAQTSTTLTVPVTTDTEFQDSTSANEIITSLPTNKQTTSNSSEAELATTQEDKLDDTLKPNPSQSTQQLPYLPTTSARPLTSDVITSSLQTAETDSTLFISTNISTKDPGEGLSSTEGGEWNQKTFTATYHHTSSVAVIASEYASEGTSPLTSGPGESDTVSTARSTGMSSKETTLAVLSSTSFTSLQTTFTYGTAYPPATQKPPNEAPGCSCLEVVGLPSHLRQLNGIYLNQDKTGSNTTRHNSRPVFKHLSCEIYVFYSTGEMSYWLLGTTVGSRRGYLLNYDDVVNPADVTSSWRVQGLVDVKWTDDENVRMYCSCQALGNCSRFHIENEGNDVYFPGDFYITSAINERPVYRSPELKLVFYYTVDDKCEYWTIGSSVGNPTALAYTYDSSLEPQQINSTWTIFNSTGGWFTDNSLKVICLSN